MSSVMEGREAPRTAPSGVIPSGADAATLALLLAAFLLLFLPVYWDLSETVWATDEQGHGPIILVLSLWLLYRQRHELAALDGRPAVAAGWITLAVALLLYVLGRSQELALFSTASQIGVLAATLLLFKGTKSLRAAWFPLFFLVFMVPLPEAVVAAVTTPLKAGVSAAAATALHAVGYPIGRAGVIISVGQYQLLVADACAGLNSMFTLEALGILYMKLMNYSNPVRNVALGLLLIPMAFLANVVRVVILVLVTYHLGDEAGQGFVHNLAGMILFLVALLLMLALDRVLDIWIPANQPAA